MPTYTYKCSSCKSKFDAYSPKYDYFFRTISQCCGAISYRVFSLGIFAIKIKSTEVTHKTKRNVNKLTNGIPIGEVPGDKEYTKEYGGHKIGEKGYIGPLP